MSYELSDAIKRALGLRDPEPKRKAIKIVYIAHQLGGGPDREENRAKASKWAAWCASKGNAPIADWIILSGEWAESPELRAKGLAIDCELVALCDEVWLCGPRVSAGMAIEREHAVGLNIPVLDLTSASMNMSSRDWVGMAGAPE